MDDSQYETSVAKLLAANNPEYLIRYNQKIIGRYSKVKRQIDVLLINDKNQIAVECKYYNSKINVKVLDSFIGFLEDINVSDGILITNKGVSKAAVNRVAESNIKIRILSDSDIKSYRISGIITYENNRGALLPEPNGWVCAGSDEEKNICCLFIPIGSKYENYLIEGNFIYVKFFDETSFNEDFITIEKNNIETFYKGKKRYNYKNEDDYFIRTTYIFDKKRYDISVRKHYQNGIIIIFGILKPDDVKWTITSIKKVLKEAFLLDVNDKRSNGKFI